MKSHIVLALTLMALGSVAEKSKERKSFLVPTNSKLRQIDIGQLLQNQNGYEHDDDDDDEGSFIESEPVNSAPSAGGLRPDSSSGRLFFKKFFLLGKKQPTPQFIIITQNPSLPPTTETDPPISLNFTGTVTTTPIDERDFSDDYIDGEDDVFEDEIEEENPNARKKQYTNYKLVKGKANNNNHQQGLRIVVPSKYLRNFQNKRNSIVVNPSATYNSGGAKVKKYLLSNNGNGNVKRKRSRKPVRRIIVKQN